MPDPNKVYESNLNKKNFNLLLFFNIIVALAGSVFLAWNDVQAGKIYTLLFLVGIGVWVLMHMLLKDDDSLKPITQYVKIPFGTSLRLATLFYLVGQATPILIQMILRFTGSSFNITSLSIPTFGAELSRLQTFSTSQIEASMAWKIFVNMFTAGNIETFEYCFVFFLAGVLLGVFTYQLLSDRERIGFMSKKVFVLTYAFVFTVIAFVLTHIINDVNYTSMIMFLLAAAFIFVNNITIYLFGVFITFWMGYHQTNNLLFLMFDPTFGYGVGPVLQGFLSWFGLIFVVYELLLIYYLLRSNAPLGREVGAWWRS